MIDFTKYDLDKDDIKFILEIKDACIKKQNEVVLEYMGNSFVIEPSGEAVMVYANNKMLGTYKSFDDMLLNHKINGKTLICLVKDLDFGE